MYLNIAADTLNKKGKRLKKAEERLVNRASIARTIASLKAEKDETQLIKLAEMLNIK